MPEGGEDGYYDIAETVLAKEIQALLQVLGRVVLISRAQDHIPVVSNAYLIHYLDGLGDITQINLFVQVLDYLRDTTFQADGE